MITIESRASPTKRSKRKRLDVIDIHLVFVPELECALAIFLAERVGLVDLGILRKLTISFDCTISGRIGND